MQRRLDTDLPPPPKTHPRVRLLKEELMQRVGGGGGGGGHACGGAGGRRGRSTTETEVPAVCLTAARWFLDHEDV